MTTDLGFAFLDAWALFGVGAVLLLVWVRLRMRPATLLFPSRPSAIPSLETRRDYAPFIKATALVLGLMALARPATREFVEDPSRGIDLALVMDMSSSMQATDLDPKRTRLDVAKDSAAEFISMRKQDRLALVTFARHADLACPSTRDHEALGALVQTLGSVRPDSEEDATGIGNAIAYAADVLRRRQGPSRVIVLLTDGEENVATTTAPTEIPPAQAAAACAALGIRVHSIAVGTGTRLPGGALRPLDTTVLRHVAESTGGAFFEAKDALALASVYRQLDSLESSEAGTPRVVIHDRWLAFVIAAMAVWLLAMGVELRPAGVTP